MSTNDDGERGPETERSVEAPVRTAGDRAWQAWRARLAEIRAALSEWKRESDAAGVRLEQLRDEAHAKAAAAQARYERLEADIELDRNAAEWRQRTLGTPKAGLQ